MKQSRYGYRFRTSLNRSLPRHSWARALVALIISIAVAGCGVPETAAPSPTSAPIRPAAALLVAATVETIQHRPAEELVGSVEDCLRGLSDYTRLGASPLVDQLGIGGETHLVRGRALREKLLAQLDLLRPPGKRPAEPLPREWHPFAVVHDAYVENVPNREIMARLYISEGTFNRTRRNAIRAIARSIVESGTGN